MSTINSPQMRYSTSARRGNDTRLGWNTATASTSGEVVTGVFDVVAGERPSAGFSIRTLFRYSKERLANELDLFTTDRREHRQRNDLVRSLLGHRQRAGREARERALLMAWYRIVETPTDAARVQLRED